MTLIRPPSIVQPLDRAFALEAVRVTEAAAIAAAAQIGRGDEHAADQAAVEAMRAAFNVLPIDGTVVIGEGERDEAPMLFIGEKVGQGGLAVDIALDPLEGTTLTAKAMANALAVMAMAEPGTMLHAPDTYMDKIAIGGGFKEGLIDLDAEPGDNINALAKAKGVKPEDISVCIMDRPRHEELIAKVRKAGAAVILITDGDVAGVIATTDPSTGIDIYIGQGGAPEGVLAAAALRCIGGQMQAPADLQEGRRKAPRRENRHQGLQPQICHDRPGLGRCGVFRHRRDRRFHAGGCPSRRRLCHHRERGDAFGHRNGALDQGASSPERCLRRRPPDRKRPSVSRAAFRAAAGGSRRATKRLPANCNANWRFPRCWRAFWRRAALRSQRRMTISIPP